MKAAETLSTIHGECRRALRTSETAVSTHPSSSNHLAFLHNFGHSGASQCGLTSCHLGQRISPVLLPHSPVLWPMSSN